MGNIPQRPPPRPMPPVKAPMSEEDSQVIRCKALECASVVFLGTGVGHKEGKEIILAKHFENYLLGKADGDDKTKD